MKKPSKKSQEKEQSKKEEKPKKKNDNFFDYVNSISYDKENLVNRDDFQDVYVPFVTNRALSYYLDTLFFANEMNRFPSIPKENHYLYLLNKIKPRKRFSKWYKKEEDDPDLELIISYFNFSREKAKVALKILSEDDLNEIRKRLERGGKV